MGDTTFAAYEGSFPTTAWPTILASRVEEQEVRQAALEMLARSYWKPVYQFIRSRWHRTTEDAKDLTQEFFADLFVRVLVHRADARRGRFRALVKTALVNFLRGEARQVNSRKRGGDRTILPFDVLAIGPDDIAEDGRSPEEVFDNTWKAEILSKATRMLEEQYRREDREVYYHVFRDYLLANSQELNHRDVADRHGITPIDVSNYLTHAKNRLREIVTGLVAETVADMDELRDEMRVLFGAELK